MQGPKSSLDTLDAFSSRRYPVGNNVNGSIPVSFVGNGNSGSFNSNVGQSNQKGGQNNVAVGGGFQMDRYSGNYTNFYTIYQQANPQVYPTADWLSVVPDATKLNAIVMPGSHDAGMSETRNCNATILNPAWVQTQTLNIQGQAAAGSRYYDIRPRISSGVLTTYHAASVGGCDGQRISEVLDNAVAFLAAHPAEFLILKFSHTAAACSGDHPCSK